ncbi:MAG: GTP 3',8-cyclase MoaA [Thermoplasmata archaeon]|nr:GTP 3',8-cyclase MoaA [Thermoplasmata archaeon]
MSKDGYGRPVRSIRISVTQSCDLNCNHCHKEGQARSTVEMTPEEIERLVRVSKGIGVRKVKLTGGEPLMRGDILDIVNRVSGLVSEVSLTTNGMKLASMADGLKAAGLARVNISLHSRDPAVYKMLCGTDSVGPVVESISKAVSAGLSPVKVNMVVFKGVNDGAIEDMMRFCAATGSTLQLIEYEASREGSKDGDFAARFFPLAETEKRLADQALEVDFNELHRRRRYTVHVDESRVTVEVVRPMHNTEFCAHCTRIRLSSDGRLKPCLLDASGEVDVLTPLRAGASDAELKALFADAVSKRRPYWR